MLTLCNQPEFAALPPSQIVPKLADNGKYIASESTFYRLLRQAGQLHHRGRSKAPKKHRPPTTHRAVAPNQLWSWDISYMPTLVRGLFFYLYLVLDIFSRKIVAWEVHDCETGELAATLIDRAVISERCFRQPLILHSDNGSPMKCSTLQRKLDDLGIRPSHSRPRVSNDNAFSESLFRTLKYCPTWPSKGFASLEEARHWVKAFVHAYNHDHCHSAIRFVTPAQRHSGKDRAMLEKRTRIYLRAKAKNPKRWTGKIRNWKPIDKVTLNPEKDNSKKNA